MLPSALEDALLRLRAKLEAGGRLNFEVQHVFDQMAALPPSDVVYLDTQIAAAARLAHQPTGTRILPRLWAVPTHAIQLERTPLLEYLFLCHRDGRLRQAALDQIEGGIPSAFLFAAVCWRLNDWARPVREAAARCARRCFPLTDPAVAASALAAIMIRTRSWGRWTDERDLLDALLARRDVGTALAAIIAERPTGAMARLLRASARTPHLDDHLQHLSFAALQPAVRAAALNMLLAGEAVWAAGRAWRWIDKSMGLLRWAVHYDRRKIEVATDLAALIEQGIADRSAMVRGVALSGAIRHLRGTGIERTHAMRLQDDPSRSVRERVAFILDNPIV